MSKDKNTRPLTQKEKDTIKWAKAYNGVGSPAQLIYVPKAKRDLIITFRYNAKMGRICQISLIDGPSTIFEPISFIRYKLRDYGMHISYFKTRYDYQGTGLGKFLYQLAQAHADKLGLKFSDGYICPVDDIKGVSSDSDDNVEKEFKFLALMYHALGNKIIEKSNFQGVELTFEDNWKHGQKIKKLDENQKEFLEKMVEYEMKQNQKYLESKNKKDKSK